jgi:hypothetical protein
MDGGRWGGGGAVSVSDSVVTTFDEPFVTASRAAKSPTTSNEPTTSQVRSGRIPP